MTRLPTAQISLTSRNMVHLACVQFFALVPSFAWNILMLSPGPFLPMGKATESSGSTSPPWHFPSLSELVHNLCWDRDGPTVIWSSASETLPPTLLGVLPHLRTLPLIPPSVQVHLPPPEPRLSVHHTENMFFGLAQVSHPLLGCSTWDTLTRSSTPQ
jgi:hypothetical protein